MMHETSPSIPITELRAAYVEDAAHRGGELYAIALAIVGSGSELLPSEVGNTIMPIRDPSTPKEARGALVEQALDITKKSATVAKESILSLATTLDMIHEGHLDSAIIDRIDPSVAVWLIEGGANKTSVVRRAIALEAMTKIYGADAKNQAVYQAGSDKVIPTLRRDGTPNPAYKIAQEIASDFLPQGDLTEFGLNVASAQQAGFSVFTVTKGGVEQLVAHKEGTPTIIFIQPPNSADGLNGAIGALHELGELEGRQLVIATNGQYRPKGELQAERWALNNGVTTLPAVAIGDEQGYTVLHAGSTITTVARTPVAYLHEMVILDRLSRRPLDPKKDTFTA